MTSRLLVKLQLDAIGAGLGDDGLGVGGAKANGRKRGREKQASARGAVSGGQNSRQKKKTQNILSGTSWGAATHATQLERLRDELRIRNHTTDNIATLMRKPKGKYSERTGKLAKKLIKQRAPKSAEADESDSEDDSRKIDMYKTLKMMKSRGL